MGQSRGVADRSSETAWKAKKESTGLHEVLRLTSDGSVSVERVTVADLLRSHAIHARDLMSLALQESQKRTRRAPPLILPRGGCVVIALGHIKAIIQPNSVVVFDPQTKGVNDWLNDLADCLAVSFFERRAGAMGPPFELEVLEEALRDVTETCQRRVCLYQPLVDNLLAGTDDLGAAETGLHRVVILKDALSSFELEVSNLLALLRSLLQTDEDMVGLMLTAHAEATQNGTEVDSALHDEVELMLENYHRQLALSLHEIVSMQRQVQAKQEFMSITLDVQRNRLTRMNVNLAIGMVSLAPCTTIAGYFGMNLPIPAVFESMSEPFWSIATGSALVALVVYATCTAHLWGYGFDGGAQRRVKEISVLRTIFQDMNRIDVALKSASNAPQLDMGEFRKALEAATPGREVSDLEVDVLFRNLDTSGDGLLQKSEFHAIYRQQHQQQLDAQQQRQQVERPGA